MIQKLSHVTLFVNNPRSGVFQVDDCHKPYEDLKKKGVQFAGAPEDRFYGVEAIMKDGLGNWFCMTQQKAWQG